MRGGGRVPPPPHPHQPGLILPSSLNVRQKAAVATLSTLWSAVAHFFYFFLGGGGGFKMVKPKKKKKIKKNKIFNTKKNFKNR
jgi:hypothetical protein